jgi:hypothetical protein
LGSTDFGEQLDLRINQRLFWHEGCQDFDLDGVYGRFFYPQTGQIPVYVEVSESLYEWLCKIWDL